MYRLRTFGGLVLERDGIPQDEAGARRKALSLLAALAAHGSLGREPLMALFWPESDPERAKGSLKQTVHHLRRQLSEPELILGTAELRLNPACIESDVGLFSRALREGDPEAAVDLYVGPFLDGVYLEGAPEFERWVEGRRGELATRYREALEELAGGAEARGHPRVAVGWWWRLQAADPFNGRVALRLMQALDASGDRAAALRHARVHEVLLEGELGISPDPAILALADHFRSQAAPLPPTGPPASPATPTGPPAFTASPAGPPASAAGPAAHPAPPADPAAPPAPTPAAITGQPPATPAAAPPAVPPPPVEGGAQSRMEGVAAERIPPSPDPSRRPQMVPSHRLAALTVGAAFLALLWGAGMRYLPTGEGVQTAGQEPPGAVWEAPATGVVSLVVLPFADMSAGGDQEYLSDGFTEELLNTLAQIPELRIPARSTSFFFKGRNLPVGEIAAQLGVDAVLEGSVRRSGDRIRITAQLIDARADRHLWSETFDRDLDDIFAVQAEIAGVVAEAMRVRLVFPGGSGTLSPTGSAAAHDLYLRGLFQWNRRSATDLGLAVEFFEEATRIDPAYARAWAGLALTYAVIPIGFTPILPQEEAWSRMDQAAARALALDSTLAEAHAARALGYHFQWRWDDAEREYLRALAVSPAYATAHQWYGEHLAKTGRAEEGVVELRRAIELDPLSLVVHNDLGLVLMLNRQFPEAIAQWERTVAMDPGFAIPLYFLHRAHLLEGRLHTAADWGRRWAELTGAAAPEEVVTLALAPGDPTLQEPARAILRRWAESPAPRWHDLAFYYILLGERDAAVQALEEGVRARAPMMAQIGSAPWMDSIRDDPRMDRLLQEVGFPLHLRPGSG
jgi:TolB-like protein/DNA-binding SARP family transcriptional activator/tetratricopeptide (TPR) repeat protein